MKNKIKNIQVASEAEKHPTALKILKQTPGLPIEKIHDNPSDREPDEIQVGKQTLRLCDFPGEILKPCPGTRNYICCGYQILQIGMNCPLNCSYCILQAYLNSPGVKVFVNVPERLHEAAEQIAGNPDKIYRIGTGEFTDSLAIDDITGLSEMIAPFIAGYKNAVIELKTKTDQIARILNLRQRERIIVSWSLNSPVIASKEEHGAPSLKKRLQAARQCQREGFVVGLHFDPLIEHPGWQDQYFRTIEMLDQYLDPRRIIWISMGCLRYMPILKAIIRKRHPASHILDGEFIMGLDGKMRYFKPIRMEMYSFMRTALDQWHNDLGLYLCMESDEVWRKSMSWSPENSMSLAGYLDERVRKFYL